VIPVLVQDATMPKSRELPESLQDLAYKHAVIVRDDPDFHHDMTRLIEQIKLQSSPKKIIPIFPLLVLFTIVIFIFAVALLLPQLSPSFSTPAIINSVSPETTQDIEIITNLALSSLPTTSTLFPTLTYTPSNTEQSPNTQQDIVITLWDNISFVIRPYGLGTDNSEAITVLRDNDGSNKNPSVGSEFRVICHFEPPGGRDDESIWYYAQLIYEPSFDISQSLEEIYGYIYLNAEEFELTDVIWCTNLDEIPYQTPMPNTNG
jgi:hypothetical protein